MTLSPTDTERALLDRYGEPSKAANDYISGFRTPVGRVLAIHRTTQGTRIWFSTERRPECVAQKMCRSTQLSSLNPRVFPWSTFLITH
jgi:hypothetical protein